MAFFNPNIKLTVPNNQINLNCDTDGNLNISGSNSQMVVNLIGKEFELNGQALPTPADISTLQNEINQINSNIQTSGVGVFSSAPVLIQPADGETPPTAKAKVQLASGSYISFQSADETTGAGIGIDEFNKLQINCNGGTNPVNVVCSELQVNGSPVGNDPAISQAISVPTAGTFTSPVLSITSNSPEQGNIILNKGSQLVLQSSDTAFNATFNCDNGGNISVGNASSLQLPCELTMLQGSQVALCDGTNSTIGFIGNDNGALSITGGISKTTQAVNHELTKGSEIILYNQTDTTYSHINNLNGNLTVENSNGYTFIKGSTACVVQSNDIELMGSSLTPNALIVSPNDGNSEILLDVSGTTANTIRCVSNFSTTASKSFNIRGGATF